MSSLKVFANRMNKLANKVEKNTESLMKDVGYSILSRVVYDTPVDTGRARANWLVNFGSSNNYSTTQKDVAGHSTVGKGSDIIGSYKYGNVVYITNNVDYIVKLNNGWSNRWQPEAGYVERSIKAGLYTVDMSILKK